MRSRAEFLARLPYGHRTGTPTDVSRIRGEHPDADIRRVVLEEDLKREYQEFLQAHNRDRPDSDGRPDRDARKIEQWARDHELPYSDDQVHFPDFRIEYEVDGRERREDVEVLTPHYRGAHMASRAPCPSPRTGLCCRPWSAR